MCNAKDANKAQIARSLGVEYKTLCNWVYLSKSEIDPAEKDEFKRLKKENARLKEENEILKKAAKYFAKVAK